ncbi:Protein FIZZY-RELATED 3 AltName: Full=Cell cycle switch protein CCS52B [Serendipita indica DSM 11827]|nr:Protein FIZZY-RELATED 3 AltName: Full=Cell cycle switch protein CCS52B [Serendipita indica DSM 11827]
MPPLDQGPLKFPSSATGEDEGQTTTTGLFMNKSSMANENIFQRLAAMTGAGNAGERDRARESGAGESLLSAPSSNRSRIRTHSQSFDKDGGIGYATSSLGGSGMSSTMTSSIPPSSPGSRTPRARKRQRIDVGDRFVPTRDIDERQRAFNLLDDDDLALSSTHRMIPHESDAAKEQANATFSTMLTKELTDDNPFLGSSRSSSPVRHSSATSAAATSASGGSSGAAAPTTPTRKRVLSFHTPPRAGTSTPVFAGQDTPLAAAYATSPVKPTTSNFITSPQKALRNVCKTPFRVLDAPDLQDDFYLNLVDWSSTNVLGVGLKLRISMERKDGASHQVKGSTLAVGTSAGNIQIWDAVKNVRLRHYAAHQHRIGALAWNESTITSGSRDRNIQHRDVRTPGKAYSTLLGHRQEVCGLKWHSGQKQLASGGNDNKLLIWDHRGGVPDTPLWKWHEHSAAVKAIAWNPHQSGILVSGGGTQDKKMRFWNTVSGAMLSEVDTGSQVCNLAWSKTSQEIVSTHGYSSTSGQNLICLWKYPSMEMVASLSGHTHRVLYLAMSPDGQTIVTGAGDETLRFWNAFPKRKEAGSIDSDTRRDQLTVTGMIR